MPSGSQSIRDAIDLLYAGAPRPGLHRFLVALFHNRASLHAIRKWRNGQRPAPRWAVAILKQELARQIDRCSDAQRLLEAYQHGPGTGAYLPMIQQKKRAAEAALNQTRGNQVDTAPVEPTALRGEL